MLIYEMNKIVKENLKMDKGPTEKIEKGQVTFFLERQEKELIMLKEVTNKLIDLLGRVLTDEKPTKEDEAGDEKKLGHKQKLSLRP